MQGGGGGWGTAPQAAASSQVSRPRVACPRCAWARGRLQTDGEPVYSRGHLGAVAQNGRTQGRRRTAGLPQPPESGLSEERPQTGLRDTGVVHNFSPSGSLRQFRDREGLEGHPGTAEEAGPGLWSWRERLVLHVQTEQCCLAAVQTDTPGRLPPTTWRKTDHYNKGYFTYLQTDSTFP